MSRTSSTSPTSAESPAVLLAKRLASLGANVVFHDPKVPTWKVDDTVHQSVPDLEAALVSADLTVVLQPHSEYDGGLIAKTAKRVFDTRRITPLGDSVERHVS